MSLFRPTLALAALGLALPADAQTAEMLDPALVAQLSPVIANEFVVEIDPAAAGAPQLESLGGRVMTRRAGAPVAVIRQPGFESMGMEAAITRLSQLPGVRRVEPNFEIRRMSVPNDPMVGDLWMIEAIELAEAWAVLDDASPVVVAVIDDGVQTDHEDLAGNLWRNPGETPGNGVDDDGNGFVDDVHGFDFGMNDGDPRPDAACWSDGDDAAHGTHVAGTVGAVGGNGVGVVGAAPRVQIMSLKLSEVLGEGGCRYAANGSITAAIDYATRMGADVISMSLGGPRRSEIQRRLLETAVAADIVVVAAAGNDGLDIDEDTPHIGVVARMQNGQLTPVHMAVAPMYPAAWDLPAQITVAATERPRGQGPEFVAGWRDDIFWTHMIEGLRYTEDGGIDRSGARVVELPSETRPIGSNFGAAKVHVAAPGKDIMSTIPEPAGQGFASGYGPLSGTSMATPAVSGAVAILRAAFPDMPAVEVKRRLMTTVDRSGSLGPRTVAGGEINLFAALCADGAPRRLPGCDRSASADTPTAPRVSAPALTPVAPVPSTPTAEAPEPTAPARGAVNVNDLLGE